MFVRNKFLTNMAVEPGYDDGGMAARHSAGSAQIRRSGLVIAGGRGAVLAGRSAVQRIGLAFTVPLAVMVLWYRLCLYRTGSGSLSCRIMHVC